MSNQSVHFMSNKMNWATPKSFYDKINEEFNFTLDACAEEWNKKCDNYFSKEEDALTKDWTGNVYMNPPYGREIPKFVKKAYEESQKNANVVVGLIPARTDTKWFHDWVLDKAEIRFIKGRIRFEHEKGVGGSASFPSLLVIWKSEN